MPQEVKILGFQVAESAGLVEHHSILGFTTTAKDRLVTFTRDPA